MVRTLASHARSHWFKSSTAHKVSGSIEELRLKELVEALLGPEARLSKILVSYPLAKNPYVKSMKAFKVSN